jgi:hypothetical protein
LRLSIKLYTTRLYNWLIVISENAGNENAPRMNAAAPFRLLRKASGVLLAAVFFGAVFLFSTFRERFETDLDEGVEVMKGLLLARGYPMYTQIWSDQPPLLTYLLAGAFRIFGFEVDVGRILVLFFLRSCWQRLFISSMPPGDSGMPWRECCCSCFYPITSP